MSWAEKELKKRQAHRMVENAMRDPRYVEQQKKELEEVMRKTFDIFLVISVAYLHDRMGFNRKRILRFLEYAEEQMEFVKDLPDYFTSMNDAIREETGVDVLKLEVEEK